MTIDDDNSVQSDELSYPGGWAQEGDGTDTITPTAPPDETPKECSAGDKALYGIGGFVVGSLVGAALAGVLGFGAGFYTGRH